jgi:hypothetical protein
MPIPALPAPSPKEIDAIEALEIVIERFAGNGCEEDEACEFLTGRLQRGALVIKYLKGDPPPRLWVIQFPNTDRGGDEIARRFDWRRGIDIRTYKLYREIRPTREEAMRDLFAGLDIQYGLAEVQQQSNTGADTDTIEGLVEVAYPFEVADREQLAAILDQAEGQRPQTTSHPLLHAPVKRGAYRPHLRTYLRNVRQNRGEAFATMSGAELWAGYVQWHQKNRANIPLPKDRRAAERAAEAIRDELVAGHSKDKDRNAR